jgi:hypothetical protein
MQSRLGQVELFLIFEENQGFIKFLIHFFSFSFSQIEKKLLAPLDNFGQKQSNF